MEAEIIDINKAVVGKIDLPEQVFGAEVKNHLMRDVVIMQLANRRRGTASTLTRHEVSGSGKKPWKQKGTGRARAGTVTSPLWRGGGIIFGPKPRDYSYELPKKVKKGALKSALSIKIKEKKLLILDSLEMERPKTKDLVEMLRGLGVTEKALIAYSGDNENLQLAARNLPGVKTLKVEGLNVYDLLIYDYLICSKDAVQRIGERLCR